MGDADEMVRCGVPLHFIAPLVNPSSSTRPRSELSLFRVMLDLHIEKRHLRNRSFFDPERVAAMFGAPEMVTL